MQTVFDFEDALAMTRIMCDRVNLSHRAGTYILAMRRLRNPLPGALIDMLEVSQLIKYVSQHQGDLKPQFQNGIRYTDADIHNMVNKPANFTFLK